MEQPKKNTLYNFYKSPDGEDCAEKTYYATKYTGVAGIAVGMVDIGGVSYPKTIIHGFYRILNYAPVYAMMGFSFASTVCIAGKIRQKSDFMNHIRGGIVAGGVYGAKCGSAVVGGRIGGLIALATGVTKYMKDNNYPFVKMRSKKYAIYQPHYDFSIKMYDDPGRPLDP